ncbi:hypothetical protein MANES_12G125201v8 [Manihot esculenta]|uniref:Uncharacterized protein n=1 Tax=Manihot esculenta TaxID=3983 RepID=A0ACB7GR04_MANES|nr:hypothetical protein MANES_12G125201v8 [Manihot esculenta]
MTASKLHVAMFPWLAFGHIIPYLELAKVIAEKGHKISFISTPRNIDRLPKLYPNLLPFIGFVKLPLPWLDSLPENAEATFDIPYDRVQYLKKAYDGLKELITRFLKTSHSDWRLYDFTPCWLPEIVTRLGISNAAPSHNFIVPPKWVPFPTKVTFRLYEILKSFGIVTRNIAGVSDTDHLKGENYKEWWTVNFMSMSFIIWAAFGSETKPSQEELTEIALGLELYGLPFFWALRKRRGLSDTEVLELRDGFDDRTKGRGVVCTSWAPQLKILAHDSVGGFLTHSGCSSVVEALQHEKALILLTFLADQGINARDLEENNMGYPIPRNEFDEYFCRDSVAESLRLVMVKEEGKIYREKAKEMKGLFGDRKTGQDRG